ncbi:hypothetical protein LHP98_05435 [Rhodobacter sp. Har01]|uniref:hypothetical protein n=1 Tax=Rhodobacter sp. Har01 TaxID=2883999 RepID=UPI001D072C27|nr:hypothetical protein [Rhodobacter sp. Har01]MCB6177572.1 hypothetical protein [Rhodobacter sp. Har01]
MGPISSVRPTVLTLGTSPHLTAGQNSSGGTAAHNGARAEPAAAAETKRPVAPSAGASEGVGNLAEKSYAIESARARAEAAQRAYMMASLAAGLNPLNDPVP